jgi:FlaA1/EpsC-like NDP-sugar epimerase
MTLFKLQTSMNNLVMLTLGMSRIIKRCVVFFLDASLCILAVWLSYYLRTGNFSSLIGELSIAVYLSLVLALPIFFALNLYKTIFRYSGWPALLALTKAIVLYGLLYASLIMAWGFQGVPRTIGIIQPLLLFVFIGASRGLASFLFSNAYRSQLGLGLLPRVLIYGAGSSGRGLAAALQDSTSLKVVGFLDDSPRLQGYSLNGLSVYNPKQLSDLIPTLDISDILLALPSVDRARRNEILNMMAGLSVSVRTLPNLSDLAQGLISASDLGELDLNDLLGRDPVMPDHQLLAKNVKRKTVLVTGAAGSIGSEICRQLLDLRPSRLILFDHSEYGLYLLESELSEYVKARGLEFSIISVLGSVKDQSSVNEVIKHWCPNTIFHAAAYKHVPLVESNPVEGTLNNVFGTLNVVKAACKNEVENLVLISTDKAVRSTNVMGATKRLAEMILQAFSVEPEFEKTKFTIVRFGNVLNSSGSVVPLFREQINSGGPITLTNPDITRYFMTIPEAAQLVIQAGAMSNGGEVFLLDMGEPVRIIDLAKRMILLAGHTLKDRDSPDGDIAIEITGLRPGEKLFEELLIEDGRSEKTSHPRIFMAQEELLPWNILEEILEELKVLIADRDGRAIKSILQSNIPGINLKIN